MTPGDTSPLSEQAFIDVLQREGQARYHHRHPFHVLMHNGGLSRDQLQQWVLNRYYYQTRIPIKDALIMAKSEDPAFRRMWIRRIHDHDGTDGTEGGLALWRRLAVGVGLDEEIMASGRAVLPGVRFACDAYVSFVRDASLVEAVASSLTELFAPDLMTTRIAAWERYYPWIDPHALAYFRERIVRAPHDAEEALTFVLSHAKTRAMQEQVVTALIRKTDILWHLLDCVYLDDGPSHSSPPQPSEPSHIGC